jgi:mono/diheme cytochrome c family protein
MRKLVCIIAVTMCLAIAGQTMQVSAPSHKAAEATTPTTGESWINHLHRSFGDTSMGKTGRLGPPPAEDGEAPEGLQIGLLPASSQALQLRGSDLYRLNCQGCHGENGQGAPPEINSVINPVRATSVTLLVERMKKTGAEISPSVAAELAKQSQKALMDRINNGGESMPSFQHLSEAETRVLIAYLKQLAGVPGIAQSTVTESPARIGELIVKSTCHTCHDATGPNPTPEELENGAIPPLQTLTSRTDELQLIEKVTRGAPILMGNQPSLHRGRMPVFYYLSSEEAEDVYIYLARYPPSDVATATATAIPAVGRVNQNGKTGGTPPASPVVLGSADEASYIAKTRSSDGIPDWVVTVSLIGLSALVFAVLAAGLSFVAFEITRLGRQSEHQGLEYPEPADRSDVSHAGTR